MLKRKSWDSVGVYEEIGQWLAVFKGSGKTLLRSESCRCLEEKGQQEQKPWGIYRHEVSTARETLMRMGLRGRSV